jgi:myo-inositol-1(or 4)-monophosphatase
MTLKLRGEEKMPTLEEIYGIEDDDYGQYSRRDTRVKRKKKVSEAMLREVAQNAGETLREYAFDMGKLEMKHADDPVSELDRIVETNIKKDVVWRMRANFVGEEHGKEDNGAEYTWIIDPIDGTKSMINGEFNSSLSIGIEKNGELVAGCVYDFMRDIMYVGIENKLKIYYDGKQVKRQTMPRPQPKIIVDGDESKSLEAACALQNKVNAQLLEKNGSIALAMAQVAAGVYDGMVFKTDKQWNVWDIAGGLYLLGCTGVAMNQDYQPIDYKVPKQAIIGLNSNLLPTLLLTCPLGPDSKME